VKGQISLDDDRFGGEYPEDRRCYGRIWRGQRQERSKGTLQKGGEKFGQREKDNQNAKHYQNSKLLKRSEKFKNDKERPREGGGRKNHLEPRRLPKRRGVSWGHFAFWEGEIRDRIRKGDIVLSGRKTDWRGKLIQQHHGDAESKEKRWGSYQAGRTRRDEKERITIINRRRRGGKQRLRPLTTNQKEFLRKKKDTHLLSTDGGR